MQHNAKNKYILVRRINRDLFVNFIFVQMYERNGISN